MSRMLYDSHYAHLQADVQRAVREETYGDDLGQASWITLAEYQRILPWLHVGRGARILEVACGSGGLSVKLAQDTGAAVVGIDLNEHAVAAATARLDAAGMTGVTFQVVNADGPLPFPAQSFDCIFCNDSINHIPHRDLLLAEWHRVLRPGGRVVYTDPIVVTGWLSNEEIALRSALGFFLFVPVGANEAWLRAAGFTVLHVEDATDNVVATSGRWRDARARRRELLVSLEGEAEFDAVQRFLDVVHRLAGERRLSRFLYVAERAM